MMRLITPGSVMRILQLGLALCAMFAVSVKAQVIEDIEFVSLPGDRFQIELSFDAPPPTPEIFEIENPARLSLDFAGASSGLDSRRYPLEYRNADSVVVLESGGRTRMVVNLENPLPYSTSTNGNSFIVEIGSDAVGNNAVTSAVATGAALSRGTGGSRDDISNIDFSRGEGGAGEIVVELNNRALVGNVSRLGNELELTFEDATLVDSLEARLNVLDFATPVQFLEAYEQGGDVIIEVVIEGGYDYIAYQGSGQYTLTVAPVVEESTSRRNAGEFSGERITLNSQNIAVRNVLQILADVNDFSLVVGDNVSGTITLRLDDVPWDQALDLVLTSRGLDKRLVGDVLYVAPVDEIAATELRALENEQQAEALAPLQTEYIEINYAIASDIRDLLMGQGSGAVGSSGGGQGAAGGIGNNMNGKVLSARGSATVDERTNTLIIQDVASKIEDVRELLDILDVPVRQVLIEARIVNATTSFGRELGIRWGGAARDRDDPYVVSGSLDTNISVFENSEVIFPDALAVDLGVSNPTSSFALGYAGDNNLLELELSALEASGNGEVIAQPKVTTQDKQQATIQSGIQVPYQAQAGGTAGGSTTEFVPAVLSLEVTPQITPDNRIIMLLDIHQDSVVTGSGAVPAISTNSVTTRVLVDDGDTVVLGGVFREEVTTTVSKTPFLGDLPIVGNLFKRTENQETKTELLIFITPSILNELM